MRSNTRVATMDIQPLCSIEQPSCLSVQPPCLIVQNSFSLTVSDHL